MGLYSDLKYMGLNVLASIFVDFIKLVKREKKIFLSCLVLHVNYGY